jgi:hypothetical protein
MSEHGKSDSKRFSQKGHGKRVRASVLVAATSLLGTSLGVSTASPALALGDQEVAEKKVVATKPDQQEMLLAKVYAPAHRFAGKPRQQVRTKAGPRPPIKKYYTR